MHNNLSYTVYLYINEHTMTESAPPKEGATCIRPARGQQGRKRSRVLFAVTGSVAAVKAPEIAVRLANELEVDVRILLTRGGENFWNKAKEYSPVYWDRLQCLLELSSRGGSNENRISMCCECVVTTKMAPLSLVWLPSGFQRSNKQKLKDCFRCSHKGEHYLYLYTTDADDEWKGWQKLGDPVLHIDLRGTFSSRCSFHSLLLAGENYRAILMLFQCLCVVVIFVVVWTVCISTQQSQIGPTFCWLRPCRLTPLPKFRKDFATTPYHASPVPGISVTVCDPANQSCWLLPWTRPCGNTRWHSNSCPPFKGFGRLPVVAPNTESRS